jgi:hypothetical protein
MHPSVFSEKYGVVGDEQATTRKWRWRSVLAVKKKGKRGEELAARGRRWVRARVPGEPRWGLKGEGEKVECAVVVGEEDHCLLTHMA